jgi:hypothetical protein
VEVPMSYDAIVKHLGDKGEGVFDYSQKAMTQMTGVHHTGGICRGLVINWLIAKKKGTNFYEENTETKGLLSDKKQVTSGKDVQEDYSSEFVSFDTTDSATIEHLKAGGLEHKGADEKNGGYAGGFADNTYTIANHVLTKTSRYYILSIKGKKRSHSIGIVRPWTLFGKSSTAYIFDPNVGEFKVQGTDGIERCLQGIYNFKYHAKSFNKEYVLRSFND